MKTPLEAFKRAIETWEGLYQDDPADVANVKREDGTVVGTMRGVSPGAWARFKGVHLESLEPEDMKAITLEDAAHVYDVAYYRLPGFAKLRWCPATEVWVDIGWGSGPVTAIKKMQQMIGVTADGVIGPQTIAAYESWLSSKTMEAAVNLIADWRCNFYKQLVAVRPANAKFLTGWLRRANWYRPSNAAWWWQ